MSEQVMLYRPRRRGKGYLVAARFGEGEEAITAEIYVPDIYVERAMAYVRVAGAEVGADQEVGAFWDTAMSIAKGIASNPLAKMAAGIIPGGATVLDGASLALSAADAARPKKATAAPAAAKNDVAAAMLKKHAAMLARHDKELRELRAVLDAVRKKQSTTGMNPQLVNQAKQYEVRRLAMLSHRRAQDDPDERERLEALAERDDSVAGVVAALDALADPGIYHNVAGDEPELVGADDDVNVAGERLRRMLSGDDPSA